MVQEIYFYYPRLEGHLRVNGIVEKEIVSKSKFRALFPCNFQ